MATYTEMAPIIQGTGVTKTSVDNYFENLPEPPAPSVDPAITKAKIVIVANAYLVDGIEKSNGFNGIVRLSGLRKHQVKAIIREINILKAAWDAANAPVEEEI